MVNDDFIRRITIDLNNKLKEEVETLEQKRNRQIAENMEDYWKHLNSGAER